MYTKEETDFLLEEYAAAVDKQTIIEELADKLHKPRRSIIGKLSRLGIYEKKIYLTKRGENRLEYLEGLEKAPKEVLKYMTDNC